MVIESLLRYQHSYSEAVTADTYDSDHGDDVVYLCGSFPGSPQQHGLKTK